MTASQKMRPRRSRVCLVETHTAGSGVDIWRGAGHVLTSATGSYRSICAARTMDPSRVPERTDQTVIACPRGLGRRGSAGRPIWGTATNTTWLWVAGRGRLHMGILLRVVIHGPSSAP